MDTTLYEKDFHAWAMRNAELMRQGKSSEADLGNIAEELEGMGKAQRSQMESRLTVLLAHLLKWQFQPERRGKSWRLTIKEQRGRIARLLEKNPSLRSQVDEVMADAYENAIFSAAQETDLEDEDFPSGCPYGFSDVMNPEFWPESASSSSQS